MSLDERAWWVPSQSDCLVSAQDLRKARRMASRSRALAACSACAVLKRKCNDYRPCSRCLRQGTGDQCARKGPRLDPPLPYAGSLAIDQQGHNIPDLKGLRNQWANPCIVRLWTYGFRSEELKNLFDSMPDELCILTQRALQAVASLSKAAAFPV